MLKEKGERTVSLVCPLGYDCVGCLCHQDAWFKGKQEAEIHVGTLVRLHDPKMLFAPSVVLIFLIPAKLCQVQQHLCAQLDD